MEKRKAFLDWAATGNPVTRIKCCHESDNQETIMENFIFQIIIKAIAETKDEMENPRGNYNEIN